MSLKTRPFASFSVSSALLIWVTRCTLCCKKQGFQNRSCLTPRSELWVDVRTNVVYFYNELGKIIASCTPARQNAYLARLVLVRYSTSMGKVEQIDFLESLLAFPGGGVSKPHRAKYILVGPVILPLRFICVLSFLFTVEIGFRARFSFFFSWKGSAYCF